MPTANVLSKYIANPCKTQDRLSKEFNGILS
jgi:hypothetical protein